MGRRDHPSADFRWPAIAIRLNMRGGTHLGYYESKEEAAEAVEHFLTAEPVGFEELMKEGDRHD